MPRANMSELFSLIVPLPSLTEQKRIAAKLDEQMATLASAQAATALRSAVLRTALDPATHPDWPNSELRHLVTFANGLWTGKRPPFRQVKVIRNTNFNKECALDLRDVALIDVEERQLLSRQLQPGDIILERSGGGPTQPVGRVALFELHEGVYSFSNFTSVMRVLPSGSIMPRFLWYHLYYLYRSGATENLQNRTSGIRNLAFDSYAELQIPVPALAQQQRIADHLDNAMKEMDTLVASIDAQAATLDSLRTSLLDAAFSGQV
jgi:type I restriction enzyme S subunit